MFARRQCHILGIGDDEAAKGGAQDDQIFQRLPQHAQIAMGGVTAATEPNTTTNPMMKNISCLSTLLPNAGITGFGPDDRVHDKGCCRDKVNITLEQMAPGARLTAEVSNFSCPFANYVLNSDCRLRRTDSAAHAGWCVEVGETSFS